MPSKRKTSASSGSQVSVSEIPKRCESQFVLILDQKAISVFEKLPEPIQLLTVIEGAAFGRNAIAMATKHLSVQAAIAANNQRKFLLLLNPNVSPRSKLRLLRNLREDEIGLTKGSNGGEIKIRFAVASIDYFLAAKAQLKNGRVTKVTVCEGMLRT